MQRFSPQLPWVLVSEADHGYWLICEICGARIAAPAEAVQQFAQAHARHQAPRGSMRLGDAVAAVAKPIAQAMGREPCTPCEARRRRLNQLRLW